MLVVWTVGGSGIHWGNLQTPPRQRARGREEKEGEKTREYARGVRRAD